MVSTVLVSPPDFADADIVLDESDTRDVLAFFWPSRADSIARLAANTEARRFAQRILVAAIDASYAMGYMESLLQTVAMPSKGLAKTGRKLAQRFARQWFKHATRKDLEQVRIYESVCVEVARQYRTQFELLGDGLVSGRKLPPFYLARGTVGVMVRA
ncbi:hypothetical protein [Variovorax sp. dw_308]|uniref:hypothetical protein n=1 Tax=Variovorax sp. dw_308 TaxID=2721546 RepID=UPI001C46FB98|nr:hypothetical protein [Variovorax sp. dw_308]